MPLRHAFTLLTRFGRGTAVPDVSLGLALPWFAMVGLCVGIVLTLPVYILYFTGILTSSWALAWFYVFLDVYVTRALHLDAVADLGDACHANGARFWHIIHDSRMGAFGGVALFMALSGLLLGAYDAITAQHWLALVFAPAFGRVLVVLFACISPPYDTQSLGGKTCAGKSPFLFLVYLVLGVVLLCHFDVMAILGIVMAVLCLFIVMWRLARAQGGCNGDFLGSIIVGGQLILLLCA